jgi:hypothetical protein
VPATEKVRTDIGPRTGGGAQPLPTRIAGVTSRDGVDAYLSEKRLVSSTNLRFSGVIVCEMSIDFLFPPPEPGATGDSFGSPVRVPFDVRVA